ncbi:MAG TPA: hypothetical protein VFJ58_13950 [Armatimonadota bacterium]|nr:hypothetical protein [Armatimonadota bacterium]
MSDLRRTATDKRALTRLSAGVESAASRATCGECAFLTFCPQNLGRDPVDFVRPTDIACTIFVRALPREMSTIQLRAQRSMPEPGGPKPGLPVMKTSGKIEGETAE